MSTRLIVTGSRIYPGLRAPIVHKVLQPYLAGCEIGNAHTYILVHGAGTPQRDAQGIPVAGLDYFASEFWVRMGGTCEPYPAEWTRKCDEACTHPLRADGVCVAAGPRRNEHMASLGADKALGFPWLVSKGTYDCLGRTLAHGIPTYTVDADGREHEYHGKRVSPGLPMWPDKPSNDSPSKLL